MRLSPSHMARVAWGSIIVALQGRSVRHVELHGSRGEGAGEITQRAIGRRPNLRVRHARLIQTAAQTEFSGRAVIAHAHRGAGMISAFKQAGSVLGSFGTPRGERWCRLRRPRWSRRP